MVKNNILNYEDDDNKITINYCKGHDRYDITVTMDINGSKLEFFPYNDINYFTDSYETSAEDVMHDIFSKYITDLIMCNDMSMEIADTIVDAGIAELINRMIEQDYLLTKNNK